MGLDRSELPPRAAHALRRNPNGPDHKHSVAGPPATGRPRASSPGVLGQARSRYVRRVASWSADAATSNPVDFRLVRNSFVTLFWQPSILAVTVDWLGQHGYDVVSFDAGSWPSSEEMFDDLANGLSFPDYFGRNLDAFNDCMRDVASGDYGWRPDAAGLVIVLKAFDAVVARDRRTAQILLDILAEQARSAILTGNRIITLVQSNDPRLSFEPVGATPVMWNDAEWPAAKRGSHRR